MKTLIILVMIVLLIIVEAFSITFWVRFLIKLFGKKTTLSLFQKKISGLSWVTMPTTKFKRSI